MCLITFALDPDGEYPLTLIANRDEAYSRPASPIHEWTNPKGIIGGRDMKAGGTWLAFNQAGKFAALTNYPFANHQVENPISRGQLITDYLTSDIDAKTYMQALQDQRHHYEGYHLMLGTIYPSIDLYMYNNVDDIITDYQAGIHTISNTYDDLSAYRKSRSIKDLKQLMQDEIDLNKMIASFQNTDPNPNLTDIPSFLTIEQAQTASAIFVEGEGDFGTVSTTALVMNKMGQLTMKEVRYPKNKMNETTEIKYNFI